MGPGNGQIRVLSLTHDGFEAFVGRDYEVEGREGHVNGLVLDFGSALMVGAMGCCR